VGFNTYDYFFFFFINYSLYVGFFSYFQYRLGCYSKIGMGAIARDHTSEVLVMVSGPKEFVDDPSLAEALAAREAVELSFFLGLQDWRVTP
jgi:hypothetical protein